MTGPGSPEPSSAARRSMAGSGPTSNQGGSGPKRGAPIHGLARPVRLGGGGGASGRCDRTGGLRPHRDAGHAADGTADDDRRRRGLGAHRVPPSVFDSVGVTSPEAQLVPPTVLTGQPPLDSAGKPEVLFVGAEFCPFCGSERWALIVALSRFGHFSTLHNMQSAGILRLPGHPDLQLRGDVLLQPVPRIHRSRAVLRRRQRPRCLHPNRQAQPAQSIVVSRYGTSPPPGAPSGSLPFVDIDNQMVTSTSGFSPAVILRQSQAAIAGDLSQPDSTIGQAIVATANYLTAGICAATAQQPSSVCASKGVRAAAQALGLV